MQREDVPEYDLKHVSSSCLAQVSEPVSRAIAGESVYRHRRSAASDRVRHGARGYRRTASPSPRAQLLAQRQGTARCKRAVPAARLLMPLYQKLGERRVLPRRTRVHACSGCWPVGRGCARLRADRLLPLLPGVQPAETEPRRADTLLANPQGGPLVRGGDLPPARLPSRPPAGPHARVLPEIVPPRKPTARPLTGLSGQ